MIQDHISIWYLNRLFGLLAYATLFGTVLLGELRMLRKVKGDLTLFRFHTPLGIFSVFLIVLHAISALADNYKWGKQLVWTQYLGFSFGDQWLTWLSLGSLAAYLIVLIALSSATSSIQALGYRNWKRIHYLTYACFALAFIHSINLGTDIKTSPLSPFIRPFIYFSAMIVFSLLIARMLHAIVVFDDQTEINITMVLCILLVMGTAGGAVAWNDLGSKENELQEKVKAQERANTDTSHQVDKVQQIIDNMQSLLGVR